MIVAMQLSTQASFNTSLIFYIGYVSIYHHYIKKTKRSLNHQHRSYLGTIFSINPKSNHEMVFYFLPPFYFLFLY